MPRQNKRLEWSNTAANEFVEGLAFVAADSPQGANLVKGRIDKAAGFLRFHPRMGKPGAVAGTKVGAGGTALSVSPALSRASR